MDNKRKTIFSICALVVCYVGLMAAIVILSTYMYDSSYSVAGMAIDVTNILGCLTNFQLIVCVAITCIDWKQGGIIAFVLLACSSISALRSVVLSGNIKSLPGMFMVISGYIFVGVLRSRLRIIEANNKFYQKISVTDSLTGLQNRRGLRQFTSKLIEKNQPFYLMFLDVDSFKYINDTMGHSVGDIILQTIAKRASAIESNDGLVARNGGDEFVIIIPDKKGINIENVAAQYLGIINQDIWVEEVNLHYDVSACIGISHFPNDATTLDDIINYADTAMYEAKKFGKNKIVTFVSEMAGESIRNKRIEDMVREAVDKQTMFLNYQPQFDIKNHRLRGFEALARINGNDSSVINPGDFIPVAERSDLILDVDKYVLRHVMNQFKDVALSIEGDFVVSVNISAKHISEGDFISTIKEILEETGYPANHLEIEITEYCMMRDTKSAAKKLNELSSLGIKIALDDFGTGYASLSNLTMLPIDLLKIDKSFIDNLNTTRSNDEFVEAIISMGHMLHFEIISEGVESVEQLDTLRKIKCDYVQGFIWGKPLSFEEAKKLCKN